MRYSFISEGESHYICMHAETAMYLRLKGEGFAEQCLQNRILFRETTKETVDQEFSDEKLFLDLSYLQVMEEGVAELITRIGGQLKDTMAMCGANSLSEITRDMVRRFI